MLKISENSIENRVREKSLLFKTLKTPDAGKKVAKILLIITFAFFILLFLPWQQNIRGKGMLTAFDPSKRAQLVQSTIAGRIQNWNVIEGQYVQEGDTILTLVEIKDKFFDPDLLPRTLGQIDAKKQGIEAKRLKAENYEQQVRLLNQQLDLKINMARNKLKQTRFKLISDSISYDAEKVRYANQQSIFDRNKQRFDRGILPLTKFQEIESKREEARFKVNSAENKYLESQQAVINATIDTLNVRAEIMEKIAKAESDLNNTRAEIAKDTADVIKMENEYANLSIRYEQRQIIAPQSGFIQKAIRQGIGETIKEGEAVAEILPSNPGLAVEMYVKAMDVPLIERKRKVRIEFDGWPALIFSGWPNVTVGTFGGIVEVIDRVDSKNGEYRMLVVPDPDDEPWPEQLRVGSGTKGWVMLDNVAVWYEIWRQLNGFPPSLYEAPDDSAPSKNGKEAQAKK